MKEFFIKYKDVFIKSFDYILFVLIIILSLQKGGFYKSDTIAFNLIVTLVGIIYLLFKLFIDKKGAIKKDYVLIALLILAFSYLLPIIFNNYTSLSDAFFEFIRYFNVVIIYMIVKKSNNKKIYINSIIVVALVQGILGIDELGLGKLENILDVFNSGYLTDNFGRLSGTIQYANTTAIIMSIAIVLIIKNIDKLLNNEEKLFKNDIKIYLLNLSVMFLITCIILTASRFAFLIFLVASLILIICYLINKKKISIYFVLNLLYAFLSSSYIQNIIAFDNSKIYIVTLLISLIYLLVLILINFIVNKLINKCISKRNDLIICIIILVLLISYLVLNFIIPQSLTLDSINNSSATLDIYANNLKENNNIIINFDNKSLDKEEFNIKIDLYQVNSSDIESLVASESYTNIDYDKMLKFDINNNDYKCIRLRINCDGGKVDINNVLINDKKYKVNYLLIPYEFINRIQDGISGSNSTVLRGMYVKDALKISTASFKNLVVGSGGEAFRNLFNMYKEQNYYSTEVHNSYIQILCESGIIGFASIIFIFVFSLIKSKNNYLKISLFILIVHNILDLNFSYMIGLTIFAVLLGCLELKKDKEITNKALLKIIYIGYLVLLVFTIFIFYKLFTANLAYKMKNIKSKDDVAIYEVIENIDYYNLRFNLDKTEYKYIQKLIEEKEQYILLLKQNLTDENFEILKSEIKDISNLTNYMLKNDKYNKTVIFLACDIYYRNIDNFSLVYFNKDKEKANEYYTNIILEQLQNVKKYYPLNEEVNEKVDKYINVLKVQNEI